MDAANKLSVLSAEQRDLFRWLVERWTNPWNHEGKLIRRFLVDDLEAPARVRVVQRDPQCYHHDAPGKACDELDLRALVRTGLLRSEPVRTSQGKSLEFVEVTEIGQRIAGAEQPTNSTSEEVSMAPDTSKNPRSVFIVYGRDEAIRKSMFEFLRSLDLAPIEWNKAIELTGEASPYIGQVLDTAFDHAQAIVVLLTPDEVAYLQPRLGTSDSDPEVLPASQARPNVLFEAGMAMGRNAERTVLVEIGEVRPFSDITGRHVVRLSNSVDSRQGLATRLKTAGCAVDITSTDWHTAGDFTPPPRPGGELPLARRIPSSPGAERPVIKFGLSYSSRSSAGVGKLRVINHGSGTALDVKLSLPEDAPLQFIHKQRPTIEKIPAGKSVTIDVLDGRDGFGPRRDHSAFEVEVQGTSEGGEVTSQNVFIDLNG